MLDNEKFSLTPQKRLETDPSLRVYRAGAKPEESGHKRLVKEEAVYPGVYALGDCADVENGHFAPIAQVAERQGRVRTRMVQISITGTISCYLWTTRL